MYTLVLCVKKHWIGEDFTDYFLYFVLSATGFPTLPLLHCTSLKPIPCQYIQFPCHAVLPSYLGS